MKNLITPKTTFFLVFITYILVACGWSSTNLGTMTPPVTVSATINKPIQSTSTPTQITIVTPRPSHTLSPNQSWRFTAVAIQSTDNTLRQQTRSAKETQIAQFSVNCDDMDFYSSNISPNGEWFAASCGYKRDQTLIVQNREGTKWVLEFKDFLSLDSPDGIPGSLNPKFGSPDEKFLYFVSTLGYSGGGNECFPRYGRGEYGLFRLSLKTGTWATLIPPTDSFNGYGIEFSPTGQRYATATNSIAITDLNTGEVIKLDVSGVMEINWSPDGTHLAYSVASCSEQFLQSSSIYVWDALTDQTQMLLTTDTNGDILLSPESWSDNTTLRIAGERLVNGRTRYVIYIYDISQENLIFTGTATLSP